MTIRVFEWPSNITLGTLGVALNSRAGKSRMARQVAPLSQMPPPVSHPTPPNLQNYIDRYGEQVTQDAVGDLQRYFQWTGNRGFTVGGLPIGPGDVMPSVTAISVIGEGLAGWYMERHYPNPLMRPIDESVDLIFGDDTVSPNKYALIQVKATQQSNIVGQMRRAVPDLLQYGYNVAFRTPGVFSCYVIGVIIRQSDDYDVMSLEINLV